MHTSQVEDVGDRDIERPVIRLGMDQHVDAFDRKGLKTGDALGDVSGEVADLTLRAVHRKSVLVVNVGMDATSVSHGDDSV